MMMRKVLAYLNMSIYFALRHLRASLPRAKIIKGWYLWSNCQIKQNVFGLHLNPYWDIGASSVMFDVWMLRRQCCETETATEAARLRPLGETNPPESPVDCFAKAPTFSRLSWSSPPSFSWDSTLQGWTLCLAETTQMTKMMWLVVIIQVMMSGYEAASIQAAVLCRYELQVAAKVAGIT